MLSIKGGNYIKQLIAVDHFSLYFDRSKLHRFSKENTGLMSSPNFCSLLILA